MSNIVSMSHEEKPRILVTAGEPAGIGPDLIIKLAQCTHDYDLTIAGDPNLLQARAALLSLPLNISLVSNPRKPSSLSIDHTLNVIPVNLRTAVVPGKLDVRNAPYVIEMLDIAARECLLKNYAAIVTTPLQKSVINDAGIAFSGHTEYFANQCGRAAPVMLLVSSGLRVALVTTHLPLRDVPDAITSERVATTLAIVIAEMQKRFGIKNPRLTVCGLNPHAGESGHLGLEEMNIISPVVNDFVKNGHAVVGPIPADTAFRLEIRKQTDVFICMYHDQGLPVLKAFGFGDAVNITLGLPIIRTSVDHGTALELAGTGQADGASLVAAIAMANALAQQQLAH